MFMDWEHVEPEQVVYVLEEILSNYHENSWIEWPKAIDLKNQPIDPSSKEAIKWSASGIIEKNNKG